jgi:hypothetical protein
MKQEYVFHMLMSGGICLSCADDGAGISLLCSDEAGISWRNAAVCVACVQKYKNSKMLFNDEAGIYFSYVDEAGICFIC